MIQMNIQFMNDCHLKRCGFQWKNNKEESTIIVSLKCVKVDVFVCESNMSQLDTQ